MSGEADEAIEVQEDPDDVEGDSDGDEPAIEVQEPVTTEAEADPETVTIRPFYYTRGEADRTVRVRAGWRSEDGDVHSLQIDNTVPIDLAQMAEDLARSWHQRQLNILAQQRAEQAQQATENGAEPADEESDGSG